MSSQFTSVLYGCWLPPTSVAYGCWTGHDDQPLPSVTITTGFCDQPDDDAETEADIVAEVCRMALAGELSERARKLLLVALERAEGCGDPRGPEDADR